MSSVHAERDTPGQCREKANRRNSKKAVTCKLRGDLITTNQTGTLNLDILPGEP